MVIWSITAQKATVAMWLSKVISLSSRKGTPGSVSIVSGHGAELAMVLEAGDWANSSTFKNFYYKPEPLSFAKKVL